jgi:hypothetical protein
MAFYVARMQVDTLMLYMSSRLLVFILRRPVYLGPSKTPYVFTAPPFEAVLKLRAGSEVSDEGGERGSHGLAEGAMSEQQHAGTSAAAGDCDGASNQQDDAKSVHELQSPNQRQHYHRFTPPGSPGGFALHAMSFQCVWFVCLGERHQKPIVQWWSVQASAATAAADRADVHDDDGSAAAAIDVAGRQAASSYRPVERAYSCVIVADSTSLPVLTAIAPM